ncbi:MAG: hypothetical protein AABZ39_11555 [Spirochaetota bacterium]
MKKMVLAVIAAVFAVGCTARNIVADDVETVTIAAFVAQGEKYLSRLKDGGKGVIVHIPSGTSVPVGINLSMKAIELKAERPSIIVKTDVYLYLTAQGILISTDKRSWARIEDSAQMKEIFGIQKGSVNAGLAVTKEKGAQIQLDIKAE